MPRCYNCQNNYPSEALRRTRVLKGYNGRTRNGYVQMCSQCSSQMQTNNAWVAGVTIVFMLIFSVIMYAVRGY